MAVGAKYSAELKTPQNTGISATQSLSSPPLDFTSRHRKPIDFGAEYAPPERRQSPHHGSRHQLHRDAGIPGAEHGHRSRPAATEESQPERLYGEMVSKSEVRVPQRNDLLRTSVT